MENDELTKKMDELNRNGCSVGKVQQEEINNLCQSLDELKIIIKDMSIKFEKTMDKIDMKWMIGLVLIILVAFMAGINVGEVIRGWIIRGGVGLP